jgi:hemerythrin superfamily protein
MDAIELVKKDHDKVEELFARFKGGSGITGLVRRVTGNVTSRERKSAVAGICHELDVHAKIEEEILYPAIRATGDPELNRGIDEAIQEHARVKEMVADLERNPEGDDLEQRVSELEGCVQHHVSEEESQMLPRVEEMIPVTERSELGRRMQARKRALGAGTKPAAASRLATKSRTGTTAARSRSKTSAARPRSKTKVAAGRSKAKTKAKKRRAR